MEALCWALILLLYLSLPCSLPSFLPLPFPHLSICVCFSVSFSLSSCLCLSPLFFCLCLSLCLRLSFSLSLSLSYILLGSLTHAMTFLSFTCQGLELGMRAQPCGGK
jgi:hypothetical protein